MLNVTREQLNSAQRINPLPYDVVALVLQGGGALGAYQAGVYEGLHEAGIRPNWLAGISIGALNAAIIAGSPEDERVERLREFWETICAAPVEWPAGEGLANALPFAFDFNSLHNAMAAMRALFQGQPGFFKPRFPSPLWSPFSGDAATSFYDTSPLHRTLEKLVDFDRLNSGEVRVSVGAVNVRTGNLTYFDTAERRARAKTFHGLRRLAARLPAVEIEGEHYWDGGVVSNTPLSRVLSGETRDTLTFQVDLWSARGRVPYDMMEVSSRQKDIQYSSRTRAVTDQALRMQKMRQALQRTIDKLPEDARQDPEIRAIADLARHRSHNIIHLIYQSKIYEGHSKDYEFGLKAMRAHWQSGLEDIRRTLGIRVAWRRRPRTSASSRTTFIAAISAGAILQDSEDAMSTLTFAPEEESKINFRPSRQVVKRVALALALTLGAAVTAGYVHHYLTVGRYLETTDDAYVKADSTIVAPKVSGYIAEVLVNDNQPVKAGQLLARIDDRDFRTALDQAAADVAAAEAANRNLDAQLALQQEIIAQGSADVAAAEANLKFAQEEQARYDGLMKTGAGTVQRAQQTDAASARQQRAIATRQIRPAGGRAQG